MKDGKISNVEESRASPQAPQARDGAPDWVEPVNLPHLVPQGCLADSPTLSSAGNSCWKTDMAPKTTGSGTRGGPRVKKEGQADLYRIGGVDLPYDPELDLDKPKPTPLFPAYRVPTPKPLTENEKTQVAHFRSLRESIHNGPLYTILGDNVRVTKPGERPNKPAASFNAFEGMPKYSQRYTKKRRMIPKLDTRPYVLQFFPQELWSTLDPTATVTNGVIDSSARGKSLRIPGYEKTSDVDGEVSGDEVEEKARDPDDDEPLEGEEVDDEYDDDDEDGGDYNAEQYFDDGGDDAGDDYDGGGDDGGGGYID